MDRAKLLMRVVAVLVGGLIAVPVVFVAPASAATIVVNTLDDDDDNDGDCSLREAVRAANTNAAVAGCAAGSPGADLITVPVGTIELDNVVEDEILITDQVTIRGAGQALTIIDNMDDHEGFRVIGGGATFEDLRVINSDEPGINADEPGQTIVLTRVGLVGNCCDGLRTDIDTTVTITGSTISDNDGDGADIDSGSTVTITGSTISGNDNSGLEVGDDSTVTITGSTISGNDGDGVDVEVDNVVTITGSTVSGNGEDGVEVNDGGTVTVSSSTFSGNGFGPESEGGDGIDVDDAGTLSVTNSTISGNASHGIDSDADEVTVLNSTVALNGIDGVTGDAELTTITLTNSIVAGNVANDCDEGTFTSGGGNIDLDGTCGLDQDSDQPETDPMLGALADNGGPTLTHLPADDSPAVDTALDGPCPTTDQRGFSRPFDGDDDGTATCDIGAVEVGATAPETPVTPGPTAPLPDSPAAQPAAASPSFTG